MPTKCIAQMPPPMLIAPARSMRSGPAASQQRRFDRKSKERRRLPGSRSRPTLPPASDHTSLGRLLPCQGRKRERNACPKSASPTAPTSESRSFRRVKRPDGDPTAGGAGGPGGRLGRVCTSRMFSTGSANGAEPADLEGYPVTASCTEPPCQPPPSAWNKLTSACACASLTCTRVSSAVNNAVSAVSTLTISVVPPW